MSEILFGDGGAIRGDWAPENKDGPKVPGEGHPGPVASFHVFCTPCSWLFASHRLAAVMSPVFLSLLIVHFVHVGSHT